jgi:hypothetical protein
MATSNNRDPSQEDELPFPNFSEADRARLTARDIQQHNDINGRYATATDQQTWDQVYDDLCQFTDTVYERLRKEDVTSQWRDPDDPSQEDELPFLNFSDADRARLTKRDIQQHKDINARYVTATDQQTFDQVYRDECHLTNTIHDRLREEDANSNNKWRSPTLPQRYNHWDPDDPLVIYRQRSESLPPIHRSQTPPTVDRFSGYATPESSDDEDDDGDSLDDNYDDHIYPPHLASLMKPSPHYGILPSPTPPMITQKGPTHLISFMGPSNYRSRPINVPPQQPRSVAVPEIYPPHLASLMKPSPHYGILPSPPSAVITQPGPTNFTSSMGPSNYNNAMGPPNYNSGRPIFVNKPQRPNEFHINMSLTAPRCRFCDGEDHNTLEERTECYNNFLTEDIKNYNDYVPPPAKNSSAPANVPARSQ